MKISALALSVTAIAATVQPYAATAADDEPYRDPKVVVGTWVSDASTGPFIGGQFVLMSIQPDGHIVIAKTGPLPDGGSTASISEKDAADSFRGTWIIAGTYRVELDGGVVSWMHVSVEKSNTSDAIGKDLRLDLKIHCRNSIASSMVDNPNSGAIWQRLGTKTCRD
jgi:hypothetical protein